MTTQNDGGEQPFRRAVPQFGGNNSQSVEASKPEYDHPKPADEHSGMQLDTAAEFGHAASAIDPYEAYPLSVNDIRTRLFEIGISKSKDSIQRYCREGMLNCVKLGMLRRYYVTEASVDALIETLANDEASSGGMQLHEAEYSGRDEPLQLHAAAPDKKVASDNDLHDAASSRMQANAGARNNKQSGDKRSDQDGEASIEREHVHPAADPDMVDFLKEQLRVKDTQIKVKDEQIAAMLERDRETNILIRGLQDRIGDAFGLLVGGRPKKQDSSTESEAIHTHRSDPPNPHVENGTGQ